MSSGFNPYEVLGVSPTATQAQITAAYRALAQIFHPDRYAEAPLPVQQEAERRMKELNEAYDLARKGTWSPPPAPGGRRPGGPGSVHTAWWRPQESPSQRQSYGVPWDQVVRDRARQAIKANEAKQAAERQVPTGNAIARPKGTQRLPSTLTGMGEARHTNKIRCRRCRTNQLLPSGWEQRLVDTNYFCSVCDNLLLCR